MLLVGADLLAYDLCFREKRFACPDLLAHTACSVLAVLLAASAALLEHGAAACLHAARAACLLLAESMLLSLH